MNELRFAARRLRQSPGFTLTALLVLAVGIGLNAAIFSVVDAVVFRPLPFPDADRIVRVREHMDGFGPVSTSYPNFLDWRGAKTLAAASVVKPDEATFTTRNFTERLPVMRVSYGFFNVLGVHPARGREFRPEEDKRGAAGRVVLTDGLWKRRFGQDANILGRSVTIDGAPFTVIGVMPASFSFPFLKGEALIPAEPWANMNRGNHNAESMARLKDGVTLQQAEADLSAIGVNLTRQYPKENGGWGLHVTPLQESLTDDYRPVMYTLLAAVALVLIIACVNLAGLMLVRAAGRNRELALRKALGASAWSIARETLSEALILSVAGAIFGAIIGGWSISGLLALIPAETVLPVVSMDARVFAFIGAVVVVSVGIFGLLPALRTLSTDPNEALKDGGRAKTGGVEGNRLRSLLVVAEIGLALVVAIGAGLVAKSFDRLVHVDPGFTPAKTLTMSIALSGPAYAKDEQQVRFWRQFLDSARNKPRIGKVGLVSFLPMSDNDTQEGYYIQGRPAPKTVAEYSFADFFQVGGDYLSSMGISLLRGRALEESDNENAPKVALVDEEFARHNFPGQDPLQFSIFTNDHPWRIVGVVRHVKAYGLNGDQTRGQMYVAYAQSPYTLFKVTVLPDANASTAAAAIRDAVRAIDPGVPVYDVRPMTDWLDNSTWRARISTTLLALFAGIALILAAIGIYGVMAASVAQRTQEIGIRLALGATPAGVLGMVLRQAGILSAVGIAAGAMVAFPAMGLLRALLFEVSPSDSGMFALAIGLLAAVGLAAGAIPAWRAARTDPMEAIRYE